MKFQHAKIGTVSHGALRPEDLISTFADEIEGLTLINGGFLALPESHQTRDYLARVHGEACDAFAEDGETLEYEDDAPELIDKLISALDTFAPPYCYFGAHPGDGSDFGFWPFEDWREQAEDDETPITEGEPEADYQGTWFSISDHGNVTCYLRDDSGADTELWSMV
jgi:hypothetical protein